MEFVLIREGVTAPIEGEKFTRGKLFLNGMYLCETLEDEDRRLECGGEKCTTVTAIPRGTYELETSMSKRFGKILPMVKDVPEFAGVRIHGGNHAEDSEGCILVGKVRTSYGIAQCPETVSYSTAAIQAAEFRKEKVTLTVK